MSNPEKEPKPVWSITDVSVGDTESVHDLLRKLHIATYVNDELGITKERVAARFNRYTPEQRQENMQKRIDSVSSHAWVAKDSQDNVIGMVGPRIEDDGTQRIGALYVDEDWQGKGVAGMLMERALSWLDASRPIELGVVKYNERAQAFYIKWGFEIVPDSDTLFDELIPEIKMVRQPTKSTEEHL